MKVFVGYDPRENDAFTVTFQSALNYNKHLDISGVYIHLCQASGLYKRPMSHTKDGKLIDVLSGAPMSTEFALTRFLIPWLAPKDCKWALFMDCDMLIRCDLLQLMNVADDKYAVMCVKHDIEHGTGKKMDGCQQTTYPRKNWSSVMLWNLKHPANKKLTFHAVNAVPGLKLHQLYWLEDHEIGELDSEWNHLVGLSPENKDGKIIHFTQGIPSMPGYENCEHSEEWHKIKGG